MHLGEGVGDLFRNPLAEVLLVPLRAYVYKRQNCDGFGGRQGNGDYGCVSGERGTRG